MHRATCDVWRTSSAAVPTARTDRDARSIAWRPRDVGTSADDGEPLSVKYAPSATLALLEIR